MSAALSIAISLLFLIAGTLLCIKDIIIAVRDYKKVDIFLIWLTAFAYASVFYQIINYLKP